MRGRVHGDRLAVTLREFVVPLFMDRHEAPDTTAEDTARNHVADLAIAGEYGVEFISYWHDAARGVVICLANAPSSDAVTEVHQAAHGDIPGEIIEVEESDVVRFLGRVHDPVDASEVESAFRVIGFTDIVGSTELLDRLGQSAYMVLLTQHDLALREALLHHRGREVKHTGDGFMVVFSDIATALDWALDVQEAFSERDDIAIRLGLAAGEPVDHDDDLFGAAVTLANRVCSICPPNEIYVADLVRDLGGPAGFDFGAGQERELKGFAQSATVYQLLGRQDRD